ncbi:bifunctional serine/threonine-protein kinase/formylglycine-generating enzyme family protein [Nodularia sphaerocarpa]|uniref:bifunctional serine/threonine-protein kinase/formylglycine-generating enzyme family protein n=1 Tax=Nodularia sphaerocarpa TaxID=137816 RepID=UPI001EFB21D4|nr:bifunctional serine/threonine-protein kinase/formylglycine-generating enzyme family protein [Nodularia sphaerocarpa]MDB9371849.1 bifunctional serine/threonine-protein kinase/formylglycine-generating enzyme family protein [Nodularia sphaerocarpa CS-585]MDB9380030.1 bifunctional serine/threonine-protein kinase/formylglycine-generating enzyme family protein [Nodularia sphaerocarpa CS-585A2]ULP71248.1 Serine/threonine-protein kinase C [Nodularia sphaerocarpa UHCC 0038]
MPTSGTVLRNRYKIINLLGSGGFGDTYLAEDLGIPINPKPKCVVKRLKTHNLTDEQLDWVKNSFEQEAVALYNLGNLHPQIPKLSEYFQLGNEFYLVQDFIDGDDLTKIITPGKKFPETEVIQLLAKILEVLVVVHQQNIIHRDISPKNIMLRRLDGKIMLIDFGAVKQIMFQNSGQTSLTMAVGTPGFMPWEQFNGKPKLASDIYAVGMVGVLALTGIPPHLLDEDEDGEVIWQNHASVSREFAQVLTRMISRRVSQRYQNATEALQAIQLFNQPIPPTIISPTIISPKIIAPPPSSVGVQLFNSSVEVVTVNAQGKVINRQNREVKYFAEDLGSGITLEMMQIPGGTFTMGSPAGEAERSDNESPQHEVNVPGFFMGKYPVTQAQYQAIMGTKPADFKGDKRPVEQVSWDEAVEFCEKLSQKTGKTYRLPSEAEWEYACRAGTDTPFYFGQTITTDLVNYNGNYPYASAPKGEDRKQTTNVGKFLPNSFGLYDMHGNVCEWCQDVYNDSYQGAPTDGSPWTEGSHNSLKLLRGGSWLNYARYCRSALRFRCTRTYQYYNVGFRVVAVVA